MSEAVFAILDSMWERFKGTQWAPLASLLACVLIASKFVSGTIGSLPFVGTALQLLGFMALLAWFARSRESDQEPSPSPRTA